MRKLSKAEKREVERRERKYRHKLAEQGLVTRTLVDHSGCFAIVMVEDPGSGRTGLLLPNGNVRWVDEAGRIGGLADAAMSGVTIKQ